MPQRLALLTRLVTAAYVLAHALMVIALGAQGLALTTQALPPAAVLWYGGLVALCGGLLWWGRRDAGAPWPLVVVALLVPVGLIMRFEGSEYYTWADQDQIEGFLLANLLLGGGMALVALVYRRPRLLAAWATLQGIALVSFPAWWLNLGHGYLSNSELLPALGLMVGLPLIYGAAGAVRGLRLPPGWWRGPLLGLGLSVPLLAGQAWAFASDGTRGGYTPWDRWALLVVPTTLAFAALLLPWPLLAGAVLRRTEDAPSRRFPHEAVLIGLALMLFNPPQREALATGPNFRIQPGGSPWLPGWTAAAADVNALTALLNPAALALVWLVVPYGVVLGIVLMGYVARNWRTLRLPGYPAVLTGAGLAWLGLAAGESNALRFPTYAVTGPSAYGPFSFLVGFWLPVICTGVLLLGARAAERPWGRWVTLVGRTAVLGALLWYAGAAGVLLAEYGRVVQVPWPSSLVNDPYFAAGVPLWAKLIFTGLVRGGFAAVIGWALWQTLAVWGRGSAGRAWDAGYLMARLAAPVGVLVALGALGWWVTTPTILRQVPPPEATGVPVNTEILVQTPAEPGGLEWLLGYNGGSGVAVYYADDPPTSNYIQGGGGSDSMTHTFRPAAPLRPNSRIEVRVSHAGVRDTVSYFTTGPAAGPTATPLPYPTGWPTLVRPAVLGAPTATLMPPVPTAVPPVR
ncbi:MAG: Ig-like domain-containing protein [Chloroflexota bacterium]|nr:Ig-like domain-containing protein [Chloroflexota bacterium]